jgi:hypothetical protein
MHVYMQMYVNVFIQYSNHAQKMSGYDYTPPLSIYDSNTSTAHLSREHDTRTHVISAHTPPVQRHAPPPNVPSQMDKYIPERTHPVTVVSHTPPVQRHAPPPNVPSNTHVYVPERTDVVSVTTKHSPLVQRHAPPPANVPSWVDSDEYVPEPLRSNRASQPTSAMTTDRCVLVCLCKCSRMSVLCMHICKYMHIYIHVHI